MVKRSAHRLKYALRYCRFSILALWVISITPQLATAQISTASPDAGRAFPPASVASSVPPAPVSLSAPPITVRGPCDPDYWIVSTRSCKWQVDCGQACQYDVYRFDGPNPGRTSSMDELQSSLQPGVPVCFMAHGSFVNWDSVINDSANTYYWLRQAAPDQPVHIIFYTWSSDDICGIPFFKINMLGRRASLNGFYLADLVARISADHPICLMGHSHGTRMVSAALHSMAGGTVEGKVLTNAPQESRRIRVVLAAAAIDNDWLNPGERFGCALCPAEAVINLQNRTDLPLLFYPLRRPISPAALAITGIKRSDRRQLGEYNQKYIDYDVSHLVGFGHVWANYYNQPGIACAIRHYVYFDDNR